MFCLTFGITSEAAVPITFNVEGKAVTFNDSTGYPYMNDRDRIMIPLRVSLEAIGCDVTWNNELDRLTLDGYFCIFVNTLSRGGLSYITRKYRKDNYPTSSQRLLAYCN